MKLVFSINIFLKLSIYNFQKITYTLQIIRYGLVAHFSNSDMLLFADDLKVVCIIKTSNDAAMLQNDLNHLCDWCCQNKLYLNNNKCKVMTFSKKQSPYLRSYYLNDLELIWVKQNNDLGIYFDKSFSFSTHCTPVQSKFSSMLSFIIRSCKDFKNPIVLKSLYCVYIHSILDYYSIVWSPSIVGSIHAI